MIDDYYAVLGVSETADAAAIAAAYRQQAMRHHPDLGGSDEAMKRVIVAYEVLRDPKLRRAYDAQRAGVLYGNKATAFGEQVRAARKQAEKYPKRWDDFVRRHERVAKDFERADYDAGWTTGDSLSGNAFLYTGAGLGFCLAVGIGMNWLFGAFIGAFLGKVAHYFVGGLIGLSATVSRALADGGAAPASQRAPEQTPTATRILPCGRCGQNLRLPRRTPRVTVKCPKCNYHFDYAPGG